ncbi:MAG TPA: Gfo/Idh/MocA family oxidoreductase [Prolixibacteraceae bacterium]|nr:Gfo/Idh/MocA family oxidoreductase [Prolixibacteraceae bacterium]
MESRRNFIKKVAATLGGITIIPASALFARRESSYGLGTKPLSRGLAPGDKLRMAFCGIGNRGEQIMKDFNRTGMIETTVLCDVDMGAKHTLEMMRAYPKAKQYKDFRVMFDQSLNDFDAVCIGTPDFSHFPITILAMSLGKSVYVEKPLSRTFNESELLLKAAAKYKVVTQMGNQGHSEANYFQFKTWVEHGIIKDVTQITAHMNNSRRWHGWDTSMTQFPVNPVVPETLDWDTWLMTAPYHAYHEDFINGQWRCWYMHGMGALGDWGAHILDTAHEFLDLGLPFEVDPVKIEGYNSLFFPQASTLEFKFPARKNMPPCTITWYDGVNNIPRVPEGYGQLELDPNIPPASNGAIQPSKLPPGKIIYGKDLTFKGGSHGSTLSIIPPEKAREMEGKLPEIPESPSNHFENFVLACLGEEKPRSPFEISAPLSQVFCLGVLAQRLNTKIEFDRTKKQITNNKLANELLSEWPPRKGWEEFYRL